tara:strand:- start:64 stop:243 length:180 start_codon:yes stop_codon:yes gene_type:complete
LERSDIGAPKNKYYFGYLERAKGFEPSTSTLARLRSTPELRPQIMKLSYKPPFSGYQEK